MMLHQPTDVSQVIIHSTDKTVAIHSLTRKLPAVNGGEAVATSLSVSMSRENLICVSSKFSDGTKQLSYYNLNNVKSFAYILRDRQKEDKPIRKQEANQAKEQEKVRTKATHSCAQHYSFDELLAEMLKHRTSK